VSLHRADEAVAPLTRSVALLERTADGPLRAYAQFGLARALFDAKREHAQALAIAREARDRVVHERGARRELAELDAWLAGHH
jgi:hypothetical protein